MADSALSHLRILDLTHHRAGPFCTQLLAGYGAQVVKVERPDGGDAARRMGPFPGGVPNPEASGLFRWLNAGKQGITLNLKSATGRKMLLELAAGCDVVVENFAPATRERLGITYEALEAVRPGIILTSISNFGQTGPYRDWQATDLIEYALGGLMYNIGLNSREPLRHGVNQAEYLAGGLAATATLTAVLGRRLHGEGDHLDVSIQESIASGLQASLQYYGYMGAVRWRRQHEVSAMIDVFPCADGYLVPGMGGFGDWETYAACLDAPELVDERFSSNDGRQRHGQELVTVLKDRLKHWQRHEIFHRGQEWGFPFGLVQTPQDLLECPQLSAREWWQTVPDGAGGAFKIPGPPFRLTKSPAIKAPVAPRLGEHNAAVYGALGYSADELLVLSRSKVI